MNLDFPPFYRNVLLLSNAIDENYEILYTTKLHFQRLAMEKFGRKT